MRRLSIAVVAAVSTVTFTQIASAADLPVKAPAYTPPLPPPFSWTGFYIGANVGGYWGNDDITTTTDSAGGFGVAGAAAIDATTPTSLRPQGIIGGVQAGYNWQINSYLVGLEADANWLGGKAERTIPTGVIPVINVNDFMVDSVNATFLATVRARLGVVLDSFLLYGTGGVAFGTLETTDTFGHFGGAIITTTSDTTIRTGWAAGAGVERAFGNSWSAKIEYLYVDLGNFDTTIPSTVAGFPDAIRVHHNYNNHVFRLGLNYRFGYTPVATQY